MLYVMALLKDYLNLQQYSMHIYKYVGVECSPTAFYTIVISAFSQGH